MALLIPHRPTAPAMEGVAFEYREGGLWLAYDQYRALERNIIALWEYIARLEIALDFYEEESNNAD